jgi:hypothetical protein
MATDSPYTARAVAALTQAARCERDFPGWLAGVLVLVAGTRGSSHALIEGRPGSWEADHVISLVRGIVGHDDEHLPEPSGQGITDAKAQEILDQALWGDGTDAEIAAEHGVPQSVVRSVTSGRGWKWLDRGEAAGGGGGGDER